ncbi:max dimerization protein 4 isoform X3 [Erinaceus europaeus]|uniref:Max dimerization protein 4 isoform X3 n=1 Tax=Erinaceus europaeus TaxID=9365 RepID=A0ABM3X691_ERIEU|nr:max dimerization protein 4 isoform X3 [Erinaceus europaeus]
MELNSLLLLLEAAEYLERRDRGKAEHGYASALPFDGDFAPKKTKAAGLVRKAPSSRSSHNELEKHRRAKLRLYLEQLKQLVPLGPDSTRHTTLSLLKRARTHIKASLCFERGGCNSSEESVEVLLFPCLRIHPHTWPFALLKVLREGAGRELAWQRGCLVTHEDPGSRLWHHTRMLLHAAPGEAPG